MMIKTNFGDGQVSHSDSDINDQFKSGDQGSTSQQLKEEKVGNRRNRSNTEFVGSQYITPGQIIIPMKKGADQSGDYRSRKDSGAGSKGVLETQMNDIMNESPGQNIALKLLNKRQEDKFQKNDEETKKDAKNLLDNLKKAMKQKVE